VPTPEQSAAPAIPAAQGGQQAQVPIGGAEPQEAGEPGISGAPLPAGHQILSREERVEYRDQHGNLLNEEQVEALKGKVEFKTRYETRTRLVDADGNEIPQPDSPQEGAGVAPPHPDVQVSNHE
jgi:dolichyl-phosphate-mannose-protein mannosyltransferase